MNIRFVLALLLSFSSGLAVAIAAQDPNRSSIWGIAPYPIIYYAPETSLGLGAGAVLTRRPAGRDPNGRPDSFMVNGSYTLKNQAFVTLAPDWYFNNEKGQLTLDLGYINMPTQFFGIGNDAGIDLDTIQSHEEDYASEGVYLNLNLVHAVWQRLRMGMAYNVRNTRLYDKESNSKIDQQQLTGADGGLVSGLGPVIDWDSRDNTFYPSRGGWYRAWVSFYRQDLGSDWDYERYNLDLRHYYAFKPNHILAVQAIAAQTHGEVPFYELQVPPIRGIYSGVFTNRNLAALSAEYRFPIAGRWSGAGFAAIGDVVSNWRDFRIEDIKYGGGAGIRYQIDKKEKINIRFDLGISRWGVFPYISILEAF